MTKERNFQIPWENVKEAWLEFANRGDKQFEHAMDQLDTEMAQRQPQLYSLILAELKATQNKATHTFYVMAAALSFRIVDKILGQRIITIDDIVNYSRQRRKPLELVEKINAVAPNFTRLIELHVEKLGDHAAQKSFICGLYDVLGPFFSSMETLEEQLTSPKFC